MKRFTFAVNEVSTHDMRQVGNHTPTKETITIDATTEELARSIARAELFDETPGVQKFHPGVLLHSVELESKPEPVAKPEAPKPQAPVKPQDPPKPQDLDSKPTN